ncbi:NUDIX hydrolase [Rhodocaloribacter litoris]|uniref:NUDIX hydrolase n=1 Tax=Rhodocaloribacter litoris TaxID=2558931 RepID=UPI001E5693D1|nr:NUDIX hydrolase [Rhodocaloribacter litoris]
MSRIVRTEDNVLLFYCTEKGRLDVLRERGIEEEARLWTTLDAARQACRDALVVVDATRLAEAPVEVGDGQVRVPQVPPGALCNVTPYLPPEPVTAAGGYVVRAGTPEPALLLIFRRGVWDLPKGKCDPGECPPDCALREVREEVGAGDLRIVCPLGVTRHGYPRDGRYEVKTTHWYLMETVATAFTPQAEEDIEAVAWVPWSEARARLGFETLRRHAATVEPVVFDRLIR